MLRQAFNVCSLDKETAGMQRAHVALWCVCVCVCFPLRPAALNALRGEDPPLCLIINYQAKSSSHQPISFSLLTLVQKIVFAALSHLMYFVGYIGNN